MNKYLLLFLILLLGSTQSFNQTKKIKIKGNKAVRFLYSPDNSCLSHKENKQLIHSFYEFYTVIKEDDYDGYKSYLSSSTLKEIREEKLQRKFIKFKGYAVNLIGNVQIKSIIPYTGKTKETSPIYICILKLPDGQSISRRVGFDPLKRETFEGVENHVGLHLVKEEDAYRIVILW